MLTQLENGCINPRTLALANMFVDNPHTLACTMHLEEGTEEEFVLVHFSHKQEMMMVRINSETFVGEVYVEMFDQNIDFEDDYDMAMEYIGAITAENLLKLFSEMPHIFNYMEHPEDQILH